MTPAEASRYAPRVRTLLARSGYCEQEICEALRVVPETMDAMPIARRTGKPTKDTHAVERLMDRCSSYIERQRDATIPRHNGYTEAEHRQIAALVRQDCNRRIRENWRYALEIREANYWLNLEAAWQECYEEQEETIAGQQRVIDSLLDYIASLPLPETVLTMDRRAA